MSEPEKTFEFTNSNDHSSSYPPIFRQQIKPIHYDSEADGDCVDHDSIKLNTNPVPLIDLQCINQNQLDIACKDWGIFHLNNHGVPITLLNKLQDHAKKLFFLPFETKQSLFINTPISYFWGTPALNQSGVTLQSRGTKKMNWVEGFNVPLDQISCPLTNEEHHPMVVTFRLLLEDYGKHLGRLSSTIYEALINNLNVDLSSNSYLAVSTGVIRVYRYLKCSNMNQCYGMDAHTDSSILSILNQDEVGGLEVLKDDNWNQIEFIADTLVINLGDMTQALSDDQYNSVKHRVKVKKDEERISICYFVFPENDRVIESSKYKPFSYGDFRAQVQKDFQTLGFKVGLARFKQN